MKLEEITVQNYRTLEDITVSFSGFYTAISGRNNAGKTSLIRVLRETFKDQSMSRFSFGRDDELSYQDSKTQWVKGSPEIVFTYCILVEKSSDPGLFQFVEKFMEKTIPEASLSLKLTLSQDSKDEVSCVCSVGGEDLSDFASKEIWQKLKSSSLAMVHDSASRERGFYFNRAHWLDELVFSPDERSQLANEQKRLQNKVKNISKAHKSELAQLLEHLEDRYEVEFTVPDGLFTGAIPFAINLKDRNVDVPLDDWGSGTRNRTQIMMSLLQAYRVQKKDDQNRITPMVIIEEPESFLHPSAQAEFGRVLRTLARDLKIQTIVTTHSPYMLCQESVDANVLLVRKKFRGKLKETSRVPLEQNSWMEPFSEVLGLDNNEFEAWKKVISAKENVVVLVEGNTDKRYLEVVHSAGHAQCQLPEGVEIVPYDGKDALKNTILLKFILNKFERVLITFDLDAKSELENSMRQLGLREGLDYLAVGVDEPGKQCIEGLIPDDVLSDVHRQNTGLVMQLTSANSSERKSAKNALKGKILSAFSSKKPLSREDVEKFKPLFKLINSSIAPK